MKLAVIGSINMDQVVSAERIPGKGETLAGSDLRYISGGKGANQAVAMARLGAEVTMFGCVGDDDNGRQLLNALKDEGVDTSHISVRKDAPTGLAIITVSENDNVIIVVSGANGLVDRAYIDSIADQLIDNDLVVLQHEIPLDTVHYAVSFCYEKGIPVVLNPAPAAEAPKDIVEKVKYLTPNEHEAALIFGADADINEVMKAYKEKLIVTQGSKGVSVCLANGEILTVPSIKANIVDTTGAGDTLNGAFSVRIAAGDSIEDALRYANTAAGLSIEKFGAQGGMPTHGEVVKRMGEL